MISNNQETNTQPLDIKTRYLNSTIQKYVRMLNAGHPVEVIQQTIAVDSQCSKDDPRIQSVMNHIQLKMSGSAESIPLDVSNLYASKYNRMKERGIKVEKVMYSEFADEFYVKKDELTEEEIKMLFPVDNATVIGIEDTVVGDEKSSQLETLSFNRAKKLKEEARRVREQETKQFFEKHEVEEVKLDQTDNAPLTSEVNLDVKSKDEEFYMRVLKKEEVKAPAVLRTVEYDMRGLDKIPRRCTFREHLPGMIYSFLNVLSKDECKDLRKLLDFTPEEEKVQLKQVESAVANKNFVIRTNIRRTFIDLDVARLVWKNVKHHLPPVLSDGRKLSGIRSKMNYYRYGPGQYFKTHVDGGYTFRSTGDTAWYTFVIYLNDNFEGGSTRFCPLKEFNLPEQEFVPVEGGMLVFQQKDLKHCGVALKSGYKHILQGMVMYGPTRYNSLGQPFGVEPQIFITTNCDC